MFVAEEYYEGKKAFREGWDISENPYQDSTQEHQDWLDGFEDAEGESSMGGV